VREAGASPGVVPSTLHVTDVWLPVDAGTRGHDSAARAILEAGDEGGQLGDDVD
jgi:hypothetical protein